MRVALGTEAVMSAPSLQPAPAADQAQRAGGLRALVRISDEEFRRRFPASIAPGGYAHPDVPGPVWATRWEAEYHARSAYCARIKAAAVEAARNWYREGASVVVVYDGRIMCDHVVGRVGTIVRIDQSRSYECAVEFPPVGRQRVPRFRSAMELHQLAPFDPDEPWQPRLDADELELLHMIADDPSAPQRWEGRQLRRAWDLTAIDVVRHAGGRAAYRKPWWITQRGAQALAAAAAVITTG